MSKLVSVILNDSVAGLNFAYAKGENEVPEHLAAEWVRVGLAEYVGAAKQPHQTAEKAISQQAKKAEKRT